MEDKGTKTTGRKPKEWKDRKRRVSLTNGEWERLVSYILMSENFRKKEMKAWEELAEETNEDGSPKYEHARSNAEFWLETNEILVRIMAEINGI